VQKRHDGYKYLPNKINTKFKVYIQSLLGYPGIIGEGGNGEDNC
jgi:hypothetical protein